MLAALALLFVTWQAQAQGVDFDAEMRRYGLVDVQTLDKRIGVELKYATEDNFVGKNMYGSCAGRICCPTLPGVWWRRNAY